MDSSENSNRNINHPGHASPFIDDTQGKELLRLARSTIEQYLEDGNILDYQSNRPPTPNIAGVFITLWSRPPAKSGKSSAGNSLLRGCIGQLKSNLPLVKQVQEAAVGAAARDPRFPPLTLAELESIRIELALLSPLRIVKELREIIIGEDGLLLEGAGKRGLLLPKVAVRLGWDRESFLQGVCDKAGLPQSCWPGTCVLSAFTTQVFDEFEFRPFLVETNSTDRSDSLEEKKP